jgi:ankyrin repeat protein
MIAAQKEDLDVLACLLEVGADVDKAENQGTTPLYWASQRGRLDTVRCLLKHGANVNHASDV